MWCRFVRKNISNVNMKSVWWLDDLIKRYSKIDTVKSEFYRDFFYLNWFTYTPRNELVWVHQTGTEGDESLLTRQSKTFPPEKLKLFSPSAPQAPTPTATCQDTTQYIVEIGGMLRWNTNFFYDGILLIWSLFTKLFAQMECKSRDESNGAN